MKYLLDTDICIYLLKKKQAKLIEKIASISCGEIGITSVTFAEFHYGVQKSRYQHQNLLALTNFIAPFAIVDFDANAAIEYAVIRADLECKGKKIGYNDLLIASIAKSSRLTLVTNNTREFKRVANLRVENWVH